MENYLPLSPETYRHNPQGFFESCASRPTEEAITSEEISKLQGKATHHLHQAESSLARQVRKWLQKDLEHRLGDSYAPLLDRQFDSILHLICTGEGLDDKNPKVFLTAGNVSKIWKGLNNVTVPIHNLRLIPPHLDPVLKTRLTSLLAEGKLLDLVSSWEVVRSMVVHSDPELFAQVRGAFHDIFDYLWEQLQTQAGLFDDDEVEALIGDLLSKYIFLHPQTGESLTIPQRIDRDGHKSWQLVTYRLEVHAVTPDWLTSPYEVNLLMPTGADVGAHPKFVFKGTTYFTDKGHFLSLMLDGTPGRSVGEALFQLDRGKIGEILTRAHRMSGRKVDVVGQSLGGALTLQAALRFREDIARADAYAPATLRESTLERLHDQDDTQRPEIFVYYSDGDIVPIAGGVFPRNACVNKYYSTRTPSSVEAHVKPLHPTKTELLRVRVKALHPEQSLLSRLHKLVSWPWFVLGCLCWLLGCSWRPIRHVWRRIHGTTKSAEVAGTVLSDTPPNYRKL